MSDATSFNVPPNHAHESGVLQRAAFRQVLHVMESRITAFFALPIVSLQQSRLTLSSQEIGHMAVASMPRQQVP
ncbi:hypothetical protein M3O57_04910 [Xanthomonas nasturtii]|uniref:Uncharacterized protein n=1 Tax=Xanthomonas nasturtii TaxID=1843581 RepID=A0A3E1KID2_9XANT|nr:hypothetical protein [Xanthomonas nasturtii]MCL1500144.1 hypothetical protein [Xanthomonas nasturtii]MCL1503889.1 hypothetical protein [Xanthomonas nasturtii]MCL1523748.1 hypothetical protein [Xanthomonas nasturtii]MCL1529636.1 hypothetical protein [Xanthomonas nasturtii]MCL1566357.1 hypothetical protein [Xanthomonas nasturtii]